MAATSDGPNDAGPVTTGSGYGASGAARAGSIGLDGVKNLELCRAPEIKSRLQPAEIIGHDDAGSSLLVNDIADSTQDSTPTSEMCAIIKL
ncbi:hypothetical protein B0O80DRAFT_500659 [Mortierella sp. GBAus27b]|nr:hypothetical protein B0O80DRAFT_500659 [Mortierella sp. GBAus27b]